MESFLYTLTDLNIAASTISNPKAPKQHKHLKQGNRALSHDSPSRWSHPLKEEMTKEKEKYSTLDSTSLKENTITQILKKFFIRTLIHKGF